jgi:hypothetical protein
MSLPLLLLYQVLRRRRLCEWRLHAGSPSCHGHLPAVLSALLGVAPEPATGTRVQGGAPVRLQRLVWQQHRCDAVQWMQGARRIRP